MFYALIINYVTFWYTSGFVRLLKYARAWIVVLTDTFSVVTSIKTLLSPWRRDQASLEGIPLDKKIGVIIMNVVSRFFGAFIKLVTLSVYLVALTALLAIELVFIISWLGLPLIVFGGSVLGILILLTPNG